jgi:hypothetical protein
VTIRLKSGEVLEGYIFDRDLPTANPQSAKLRLMLKAGGAKRSVLYSEIDEIEFSGRDMADGKSWAAWVKRYFEQKAAGVQNIEIVPEPIEQ